MSWTSQESNNVFIWGQQQQMWKRDHIRGDWRRFQILTSAAVKICEDAVWWFTIGDDFQSVTQSLPLFLRGMLIHEGSTVLPLHWFSLAASHISVKSIRPHPKSLYFNSHHYWNVLGHNKWITVCLLQGIGTHEDIMSDQCLCGGCKWWNEDGKEKGNMVRLRYYRYCKCCMLFTYHHWAARWMNWAIR